MEKLKGFCFVLFVCFCFGMTVADYNSTDYTLETSVQMSSATSSFSIDPNDYDYLVYDCGDGEIQGAMDKLNLPYTLRNKDNPVTAQDLNDFDILIVGWKTNILGTNGLDPTIIENGITGRVILTGHDTDYHADISTPHDTPTFKPAQIFLMQCIEYILSGNGTGLLAHGEPVEGFNWVPDSWGIEVIDNIALENVTAFTQDGIDTGIFDNLTKEYMSDWRYSFHNGFDKYGIGFKPFEMGMIADANSVITIGANISPRGLPFTKVDDVDDGDCRSPEDEITYTICWENSTDQTYNDVWIIDYLPEGVTYEKGTAQIDPNDFFNPIPADPNYTLSSHYYIWELGDLAPNASGCVKLKVKVNYKAEPGMYLHNVAEIWASDILLSKDTENTLVCCWDDIDPNVIYVNEYATGHDTGVDWENAYSGKEGVEKALNRASHSLCNGPFTIHVAQGLYLPGRYESSSFALPDDTLMYGGYNVVGNAELERNPDRYETILSGRIGEDTTVESVVVAGDDTLVDGFVIQEAAGYGIFGEDANSTIKNCILQNNGAYAIHILDGDLTVEWCSIMNKINGIYHYGGISQVLNTEVLGGTGISISTDSAFPTIKNSVVWNSSDGIKISNPSDSPVLYNNTIGLNNGTGLQLVVTEPNFVDYPDVDSCIIWYNGEQIIGFNPDLYATNSCIQDCNAVNDNYNFEPGFAYTTEPNDIPDPNNYHLAWDSDCNDLGNPLFGVGELDIDAEDRVYGSCIDIGADEISSCDNDLSEDDIYKALDWNVDGIINLGEFTEFSAAWLSRDPDEFTDPNFIDPNDSINWNSKCNIVATGDSTYAIDLADMTEFTDNYWLWMACWKKSRLDRFDNMGLASMPMSGGESMMAAPMMTTMSVSSFDTVEEEPVISEEEKVAQTVLGIFEINEFLDTILEEGSEEVDIETVYTMKDSLEEILMELEKAYNKGKKSYK